MEPSWSNLLFSKDQPGSEILPEFDTAVWGTVQRWRRPGSGTSNLGSIPALLCADSSSLLAPAVQGTRVSSPKGLTDQSPRSQCSFLGTLLPYTLGDPDFRSQFQPLLILFSKVRDLSCPDSNPSAMLSVSLTLKLLRKQEEMRLSF